MFHYDNTALFLLICLLVRRTKRVNTIFLSTIFQHFVKGDWYTIGVVEYQALHDRKWSPKEILEWNTHRYVQLIEASGNDNLVVIVFPEGTLDDVQKHQDLKPYSAELPAFGTPCDQQKEYPTYLHMLSCIARQYQVSIVFNMIQARDYDYFTSDVVLNHRGYIEYSIRKENRIGIEVLRKTSIPLTVPGQLVFYPVKFHLQTISVISSFAVTSIVVGFLFSFEKVLNQKEVTNYLICSSWVSQLPFLTSLQVHQMWAQEFNMTMFFSGANNPKKGQGGTGIYLAERGPLLMEILPFGGAKVYLYNFSDIGQGEMVTPIDYTSETFLDQASSDMDNFYIEVDPDLLRYESVVLDPQQQETETEVCYNKTPGNYFCCHFQLNISSDVSLLDSKIRYTYHLVAYRGYKTYYHVFEPGGVEICAVIACLDSELGSCGKRFKTFKEIQWPITFHSIVITAKFGTFRKERYFYSLQFPNSLLTSMRPIHPNFTQWSKRNVTQLDGSDSWEMLERTFALIKPHKKILTFGIFGRNFTLDDPRACGDKYYLKQPLILVVLFFNIYTWIQSSFLI